MAGEATVSAAVAEAVDRKRRSEEALKKIGIVVPAELPRIVSSKEMQLRDLEDAVRRLMVLCIVAARAEKSPLPVAEVLKLLAQRGLAKDLSPAEQVFLGTRDPDEKSRQQYLWRYEAAWTLAWALGFTRQLGDWGKACPIGELVQMVVPKSLVTLMQDAKMRKPADVLDATDLAYRLHWAAREHAEKKGKPLPGVLLRVVYERHYALNWLIGRAVWDGVVV